MKSIYSIANEIGVTHQNIRNRITVEFIKQFQDHIIEQEGNIYFDTEIEDIIKLFFSKNDFQSNSICNFQSSFFDNVVFSDVHLPTVPTVYWIMHSLHFPLSYSSDILIQAVENHRSKLMMILSELDTITNQLIPIDYSQLIELRKYRR